MSVGEYEEFFYGPSEEEMIEGETFYEISYCKQCRKLWHWPFLDGFILNTNRVWKTCLGHALMTEVVKNE